MTEPSVDRLASKPPCYRGDAEAVVGRLRDNGHVAYFAGGCVRDILLGREPKDFDVATDAPPKRVRQLFSQTQAVGAAFGVILVRHGRSVIEVATFRAEGTYSDGRRPDSVRFTNAEEDAKRRDFTINGLFLDPATNQVIDYVGGQRDLKDHVLRAIGNPDERFAEDHLRLLRAVRFAARFGLSVEPATAAAVLKHAPHLARISPERIADELRQMLTAPTRNVAWQMLWDLGLLPVILRQLPGHAAGVVARGHGDGAALFPAIAPVESISFGLALAGLVLDYRCAGRSGPFPLALVERPEVHRVVQAMRQGLKISNDEADAMAAILSVAPLLRDDLPSVAAMKRFMAGAHSCDARRLLRAVGQCDAALAPRIVWLEEQFRTFESTDYAPEPLITGDDLTAAGLRPGPVFKRVLDAVYDAQLEGRVVTKEEAMAMALAAANG